MMALVWFPDPSVMRMRGRGKKGLGNNYRGGVPPMPPVLAWPPDGRGGGPMPYLPSGGRSPG